MSTRFFFLISLITSFLTAHSQSSDRYNIIPQPTQLTPRAGEFVISQHSTITVPTGQSEITAIAEQFVGQINQSSGLRLMIHSLAQPPLLTQNTSANSVQFVAVRDTTLGDEGYRIDVMTQLITVEANAPKGFFYAVQTLLQLLPPAVFGKRPGDLALQREANTNPLLLALPIPACRIQDRPRYPYRGMHLDVSRHFFSVAFIKKHLDMMALHKFNQFHWHLTDDQGWRIEIKKYSKLTQIGSHRRETIVGHYDDYNPQVFDGKPYSGFYTQDDIREVVRYAATKYINVVPEIEMPGHALAALAAYPELGCTPQVAYPVATKWGVFDDVYCPTEKTFGFLEDVLTEVMALFPSQYIHIGGDECPKSTWRNSAFCQQLIKRLNLHDEHELQLYIIARIDKFVTLKGRRIIGWDEILEGNGPRLQLSPDATVMSWRNISSGIQAARQQHDVIMTPSKFCYLDYYQGSPAQEPTAFGGSLPLIKVYNYDPTPAELSASEAKHILGTQGNVWTEYIDSEHQAEYMMWPRAAALAEVAWTPVAQKNYDDFVRRLSVHFERLDNLHVTYARTIYEALPVGKPMPDGGVEIMLSAGKPVSQIRYTLDGSTPSGKSPLYENPIELHHSAAVRTATFEQDKLLSQLAKGEEYLVSKATGKSYTLLNAPILNRSDKNYSLTNGTTGSLGGYEVADIVAFKSDMNAVIDLGKTESVESVRIGFLNYPAKTICLPKQIEISLSEDGKTFTSVLITKTNPVEHGKRAIFRLPFTFAPHNARYVRIIARKISQVPPGLRGSGKPAQLAVDEIEVQ